MTSDSRSFVRSIAPTSSGRVTREIEEADEAILVERVREGDEAAFETIFRCYYGPLVAFSYRFVQSEAVAEELIQETFLRIWANRASWKIDTRIRAYLFAAVRNRCLNQLDRQRVNGRWRSRADGFEDGTELTGRVPTPEEQAEAGEVRAAVGAAIASLPERARLVATLRWQRGLSYAEIAEAMGITRKGVENQLGRVMKTLRAKLGAYRAD